MQTVSTTVKSSLKIKLNGLKVQQSCCLKVIITYAGILVQGPVCILPYEIQIGTGAQEVHNVLIEVRSRGVPQIPVHHANPQL